MKGFVSFVIGGTSFIGSLLSILQALVNYFYYDLTDINWSLLIFLVLLMTVIAITSSAFTPHKKLSVIPQVYSILYFIFAIAAYAVLVYQNSFIELDVSGYVLYSSMFAMPLLVSVVVTKLIENDGDAKIDFYSKTLILCSFLALMPMAFKYIYLMGDSIIKVTIEQVFSELFTSLIGASAGIYLSLKNDWVSKINFKRGETNKNA